MLDFKKWLKLEDNASSEGVAYHTTDDWRLSNIMDVGLIPQIFKGQQVTFFSNNPNAYKPAHDEIQLRFPWPADAQLFDIVDGDKEYITRTTIPPNKIEQIK